MMEPAPFFDDVAEGPDGGRAFWLTTADGARIRMGVWNAAKDVAPKGTVLLFPGRTEYVEKYGITAQDLTARGYAMISIDWRGQGIADRDLAEKATGHVHDFMDYQQDVRAVTQAAAQLDLPRPWYLIGHSMGGAIGLRALEQGLEVKAAAFSAPMWGIRISSALRPIAWALGWSSQRLAFGHWFAPGTEATTYVVAAPFEDNTLTTDPEMFDYMKRQLAAHPELALGGPSMHWLFEALSETRKLRRMPAPDMPTFTGVGSNERIVDAQAVKDRMSNWTKGELKVFNGAEHEILMETPATRTEFLDHATALFEANA